MAIADQLGATSSAVDNPSAVQAPNIPPPNPGIQVSGNAPAPQPIASTQQHATPAQQLDFSSVAPVQQPQQDTSEKLDFSNVQPASQPQPAKPVDQNSVLNGINKFVAPLVDQLGKKFPEDAEKYRQQYLQELKDNPLFHIPAPGEDTSMSPLDVVGNTANAAGAATGYALGAPFKAAIKTILDPYGKALGIDNFGEEIGQAATTLAGLMVPVGEAGKAADALKPAASEADLAGSLSPTRAPQLNDTMMQYKDLQPHEFEQPAVASDQVAQQYVSAQKQLQQLLAHGEPTDAQGLAQKQVLEKQINELGPQIFGDQTKQAFMPKSDQAPRSYTNIKDNNVAASTTPEIPNMSVSDIIRENAGNAYKKIGNANAPASVTNSFLDKIKESNPVNPQVLKTTGLSESQKYVDSLQNIRDEPLSMQTAMDFYTKLGDKIQEHTLPNGRVDSEGRAYTDIQNKLWDSIQGTQGADTWNAAKQDWMQAAKASEVERLVAKAQDKTQPARSLQTAASNLLNNPVKMRGWSSEEQAALSAIAKTDKVNDALGILGSRLVPMLAGIAEIGTGGSGLGTLAVTGASHMAGSAARGLAAARQVGKADTLTNTIIKGTSDPEGILNRINQGKK